MTAPIRSMPELVAALRLRRDELQLTHETIDAIAGWSAGYASKLLAPEPIKNLGWSSLGLGLGALGIALVVVPDEEQAKRVRGRWTPRERPQRVALASMLKLQVTKQTSEELKQMAKREKLRIWGQMGGKASGKRRMKVMKKRTRQRIAAHAARMRWSKRVASHA